jgi:A/G-specific adenine glycosylase
VQKDIVAFQEIVWEYYRTASRDLPWRKPEPDGGFDPYKILVSEIMLQQTQAGRVIPKYQSFLQRFPTTRVLAQASLAEVLVEWSGLGYNRRAKFLWQSAQMICDAHNGIFPDTIDELVKLPGVGHNTAAAVVAYAYDQPVTYVETNIRTVFIHHFFNDAEAVSDKELLPLIATALDHEHPREWYWALMDYGSHLKATLGNVSRYSKHYTTQSTFEGSRRQLRGAIIKLLKTQPLELPAIQNNIPDDRLESVLVDLMSEGMISQSGKFYML